MRHLPIIAALWLAGCATVPDGRWGKDGGTAEMFNADRGQCVAQAYVAPTPNQQAMIFTGCMQGKGWAWVPN